MFLFCNLKPCSARTAVPNQGFSDPWRSETRFSGVLNAIFEIKKFVCFWMYFFKSRRDLSTSLICMQMINGRDFFMFSEDD